MKRMVMVMAAGLVVPGVAWAEEPPQFTVQRLGDNNITLHNSFFLQDEERAVLELVATDPSALALFVPEGAGFAALAVSPDDGFIRDGVPVASAVALSGLPDAEAAREAVLAACEAARVGASACVVVLEVAPSP